MKLKSACQCSSFRRWKRLVQRRFRMRVQIVLHQHHHLRIRERFRQAFERMGVIQFCSPFCDPDIPIARQWFDPTEQVRRAQPFVFVILAFNLTRFRIG